MKGLFTETLSRTTFWLEAQNPQKVLFTLLILASRNATSLLMASIFRSKMGRIWRGQPGMQAWTPISGTSSRGEMIWRPLVMWFFTLWRDLCLGKGCLGAQRLRNMPPSRKKRRRRPSTNFAKINRRSLESLCITVVALVLPKIQIMVISLAFSKRVWKRMDSTRRRLISSGIRTDFKWRRRPSRSKWWM